jgi:hypothetical protein
MRAKRKRRKQRSRQQVQPGSGRQDHKMARQLRQARSRTAADEIARENGLTDADDAVSWLRERT